ncbi:uncharacterized protein TRAVEDRAFT_73285 [Trametes versicolor FP-101664 SS1]|uniref:uncharacterized protein n=1 Tax=Trametes versicolor (strain FP-101664) TaxID=717944 RepID=UPI00046234D1|nr:uncharacterized protein TRAVEDRAFT_73285 [Trametes versicolor FP-101664 SS1]EIW56979.1 hypothetical protein TRAVEDRAFT_73285 [Trametes versicolor FP-101664 SS1]
MRILSIVPNTAPSEREFSKMGAVHTKERSRLANERVRKMVAVKDDITRLLPSPQVRHTPRVVLEPTPSNTDAENDALDPTADAERPEGSLGDPETDSSDEQLSFSAIVDNFLVAAALFDHAAETSTTHAVPNPSPDVSIVRAQDLYDLLLSTIFDYSSAAFAKVAHEVWTEGALMLEAELRHHEHPPPITNPTTPSDVYQRRCSGFRQSNLRSINVAHSPCP